MILFSHAHQYDNGTMWDLARDGHIAGQYDRYELKRKLYRAIANVNILEGIRFYVSFACSFAFGENKLMEGSAKILSLIARDESQHLVITQNILNKWKNGDDPEMERIAREEGILCTEMFKRTVDEEKCGQIIFSRTVAMIGLNDRLLYNYVEWIANRRMKAIGLETDL